MQEQDEQTEPLIEQPDKPDESTKQEPPTEKKTKNSCCGLSLKKETTSWNVFAIMYTWFMEATIGGFVSAQMAYLLLDEDYFAVNEYHIGRTASNILLFSFLASMLYSGFSGWIYDRFGRKWPIFIALISACVLMSFLPQTCPSVAWLTFIR